MAEYFQLFTNAFTTYMMRHAVSCDSPEDTYFCCCCWCHFVRTSCVNIHRSAPYASRGVAVISYSSHRVWLWHFPCKYSFILPLTCSRLFDSVFASLPLCRIHENSGNCLHSEMYCQKELLLSYSSSVRMQNVRYASRLNILVFMNLPGV